MCIIDKCPDCGAPVSPIGRHTCRRITTNPIKSNEPSPELQKLRTTIAEQAERIKQLEAMKKEWREIATDSQRTLAQTIAKIAQLEAALRVGKEALRWSSGYNQIIKDRIAEAIAKINEVSGDKDEQLPELLGDSNG